MKGHGQTRWRCNAHVFYNLTVGCHSYSSTPLQRLLMYMCCTAVHSTPKTGSSRQAGVFIASNICVQDVPSTFSSCCAIYCFTSSCLVPYWVMRADATGCCSAGFPPGGKQLERHLQAALTLSVLSSWLSHHVLCWCPCAGACRHPRASNSNSAGHTVMAKAAAATRP